MDSPLGIWVYALANIGFVAVTGILAGLTVFAYRCQAKRSYLIASLGFGVIILGGVAESVFTFWVHPAYLLTRSEFLYLQAVEDVLLAFGIGLLFFAITQHDTATSKLNDTPALVDEEDDWLTGLPNDD